MINSIKHPGPWITMVRAGFIVLLVLACGRKDTLYQWKGDSESRRLILRKDKTFILTVDGGYFTRTDTGVYRMAGDTLILNPGRADYTVDSLVEMDSLFNGIRFIEIMQEELTFDTLNRVVESYYRPVIFPSVLVNGKVPLEVVPDDHTYRKMAIADTLQVRHFQITIPEKNTCRPFLRYQLTVKRHDPPTQSFRVYLRSPLSKGHYLAGFKWLVRGDTIESSFQDEMCESTEVKLVKE